METKLFFKNSKGDRLCGILSDPTGNKETPLIILCHGFHSHKNRLRYIQLSTSLCKKGISNFRFDFCGHGESEGNFSDITITEAVGDILQSIKFIKDLGYRKIGLFGSSFGGNAAMMAASKTTDIFILTLDSPVSNYEEREKILGLTQMVIKWKEKGYRIYEDENHKYRLNYSLHEDYKNNDSYKIARNIKIPVLIMHGDNDTEVPVSQSIKISKLIPDCKLEIIKGGDHNNSKKEHRELLIKGITDFIVKHLK